MNDEVRGRFRIVRPLLLCGWVLCLALGVVNARMGVAESFNERFQYIGSWSVSAAFAIAMIVLMWLHFKVGGDNADTEQSTTEESATSEDV